SIEDSFARVRAGIILALLVWIVGLGMHSLDKRFIEKSSLTVKRTILWMFHFNGKEEIKRC
ncbi:hypothetical protein, partial [Treponema pedis]